MCWSFNSGVKLNLTVTTVHFPKYFPENPAYSRCASVFLTAGKDTSDPWLAPEKKVQLSCVGGQWVCQQALVLSRFEAPGTYDLCFVLILIFFEFFLGFFSC